MRIAGCDFWALVKQKPYVFYFGSLRQPPGEAWGPQPRASPDLPDKSATLEVHVPATLKPSSFQMAAKPVDIVLQPYETPSKNHPVEFFSN